jgi:hypothetical protein
MAPVAGNSGENAGADRKKGANAWKSFHSFLRFKLGLAFQTSLSKKPTRSDLPTHTQWLTTRVLGEFIATESDSRADRALVAWMGICSNLRYAERPPKQPIFAIFSGIISQI